MGTKKSFFQVLKSGPIYIIIVTFLHCSLFINAQNCEETISTNPDNPVNTEMQILYPSLDNPWINSFNFGAYQNQTFDPIVINPGAGWQVPDWTNPTTFQMSSPFTTGGVTGGDYLTIPDNPLQARDFHWEDGWELLYLGIGYYPNGDPINLPDTNRIISQGNHIEKVEELTLYILQLSREIETLKAAQK